MYHTNDGGQSWEHIYSPISDHIYDIYFINSDTGWVAGGIITPFPSNSTEGVIERTTDGGNSWVVQFYEQPGPILRRLYFIDKNNGYAIGGAYLLHTTNSGNSWTEQTVAAGFQFDGIFFKSSSSRLARWKGCISKLRRNF